MVKPVLPVYSSKSDSIGIRQLGIQCGIDGSIIYTFFFLSLAFTTSAYVLHRRTREDNPDEHDVWAFNETKTIESLGVTNDGILSVSLRGRSLCFSWVCGLCGLVVLWLWLWLSKKTKKEGSVTDRFLPFTSSLLLLSSRSKRHAHQWSNLQCSSFGQKGCLWQSDPALQIGKNNLQL